jgi:RNA polymerase sigma factor (sigma-70 family)
MDSDRFDRLYSENLPLILGYAARRCAEYSDAADVAAEVFTILWRRLDEVPAGEERLWLFGVARRTLANHRRGQQRRSELTQRLEEAMLTHHVSAVPEGRAAIVSHAVAQLPDRDRELLTLAVWDGLSPTEIAMLEGIPAGTVRSQLMRARTRLRRQLERPPRPVAPEPALRPADSRS